MSSQYGAHLASSHGAASAAAGAGARPSIFEVLAQENLALGLRTAVRYVAHFSAQSWPARWGFFYRYADEIILAMDALMQYHHLRKYNASFAEHFYGLAREGRIRLLRCLLLLSVLPYIRSKLEQLYQEWKAEAAEGVRTRYERLRSFHLRVYPYVHFVLEGSYFASSLLYALGRTDFHSLPLWLSGTQLGYFDRERHTSPPRSGPSLLLQSSSAGGSSDAADGRPPSGGGSAITPAADDGTGRVAPSTWTSWRWYLTPLILAGRVMSQGADHATTALMTGAFLLQFLEWWYQNNDLSPLHRGTAIPPSPAARNGDAHGGPAASWPGLDGRPLAKGVCPVCKESIVNETVLATSGIAFCYSCIFKHLLEHNSCPVTGYPSSVDALIQVYQ